MRGKLLDLLRGEIYPSGRSSIYIPGFFNFVINFAIGALATIFVFVPLSLVWPIQILVKRQMSEKKVSFMVEELEGTLRQTLPVGKNHKSILVGPYYSDFPNHQLAKMYGKYYKFLTTRNKRVHRVVDYVWPIFGVTRSKVKNSAVDFYKAWNSSGPLIRFSSFEIRAGEKYLSDLFAGSRRPYITFCHGSKAYRETVDVHDRNFVERPLSWISVELYRDAIEYLNLAGFNVARFGKYQDQDQERIDKLSSNFYDACQSRSDFSDVFLNSRCSFILSGVSGGWWLGAPFNKPVVSTNLPSPIGTIGANDLFIPCMPWIVKEQIFASFSWQFENFNWSSDHSKLGSYYIGVRTLPSQIVDLVDEMLRRLSGEWIDTVEDLELQARFKKLQDFLNPNIRTPAKIGAKFLREHQHLLPD